jgi:hypothetical protein
VLHCVCCRFIGVLFNFMQALPLPTTAASLWVYLLRSSLIITLAFCFVLLYANGGRTPADPAHFAASIPYRVRLYAHLYGHMPLELAVTVASATARHLAADLSDAADGTVDAEAAAFGRSKQRLAAEPPSARASRRAYHASLFALSCAAVLLLMSALALLAVGALTRRRAVLRLAGAAALGGVAALVPLTAMSVLATVVALLGLQVLLDYLR